MSDQLTAVVSHPPSHRVVVEPDGLVVRAVPKRRQDDSSALGEAWSRGTIAFPDDVDAGSVVVRAAIASEWHLDAVVELAGAGGGLPHFELWRLSPTRIRRRERLERGSVRVDGLSGEPVVELADASRPTHRLRLSYRRPTMTSEYLVEVNPLNGTVAALSEERYATRYDIFLSYKKMDHPDGVDDVVAQFEQMGLTVWWDKRAIVENFVEAIRSGIEASNAFFVLWSANTADKSGDETLGPGRTKMNQRHELNLIRQHLKDVQSKKLYVYYVADGDGPPSEFVGDHHWVHHRQTGRVEAVRNVGEHLKDSIGTAAGGADELDYGWGD